jgi:hypothetical protein
MTRARFTAWTLLAAAGFALAAESRALGQDALPKRPDAAFAAVRDYRDRERGGIPPTELKAARDNFAKFAKYYADIVAHPAVWKASQDVKIDTPGAPKPPTLDHGINGIYGEMDRFLLEAVPGGTKVGPDQAIYIHELGAALDAAFRNLIETHQEPIVRVNAARTLAQARWLRSPAPGRRPTSRRSRPSSPRPPRGPR